MADSIAIGCARGREPLEMMFHPLVQILVLRQQVREPRLLRPLRQLPVNQQIRRLHERGLHRQLLNRDAAIPQNPLLSVNKSHRAAARTGVRVAVIQRDVARHVPQRRNIHRLLPFAPRDCRQLVTSGHPNAIALSGLYPFAILIQPSPRFATLFRQKFALRRISLFGAPLNLNPNLTLCTTIEIMSGR